MRPTQFLVLGLLVCVASPASADPPGDTAAAPLRRDADQAGLVLSHFLASEQTGMMKTLGNWLETYALTDEQVQQLIGETQQARSDDRRNLLFHAIRGSRSRIGREFLLRNLVEDTDEATQVRFIQTLENLAPFDVPLLTAMYLAGEPPPPADKPRADTAPGLREEIVNLATRDERSLSILLTPRPQFLPTNPHDIMMIELRTRNARQARIELLVWLAKNAATEEDRLKVIEPALAGLDATHQKLLARDVLAVVKDPVARGNVIPQLFRYYALDPYPLLVSEEDESVRLSILRGLNQFASTYGYSLSAVSRGQETLEYIARSDSSPQVREAAQKLLDRIAGTERPLSKAKRRRE